MITPNAISIDLHRIADLTDPEHTLSILEHRHTSYRALALIVTSAIFLLLAFSSAQL